MEILEVKDLFFTYPEKTVPALNGISLSIDSGDFFVLCGKSGCGKSTLLRQFKPQLAPHGNVSGEILFEGTPLNSLDGQSSACEIGFVMQSPDNQIVTDKVWHELAFGLESMGYDTPTIRRRVAETASFFGIHNWFHKNVSELSGGQKQLLNLAAVMVMQPKILILDEPTSQLDPIAASDFLATLKKLNTELGTTIVLSEHRLEEALPLATKAAVMEDGKLLCCTDVRGIGNYLKKNNHSMFLAMPSAMRIWGSVDSDLPCSVSVNEGREFLKDYTSGHTLNSLIKSETESFGKVRAFADGVWFKYQKELPDVIKGTSLSAYEGELLCILGGNGTGKTTALKLLAGIKKPYRGEIKTSGRVGFLPQNPQALFVKKTVYDDLSDALAGTKQSKEAKAERVESIISLCCLNGLESSHPYDLSGGEQQRVALAKLLLTNPDILLLDEPTKGMDTQFKSEFALILQSLKAAGVCIIMVSHDVEFCAMYADRCALFFDGAIITEGTATEFFSGNSYYTTCANRIARNIIPDAVTTKDVIKAIGGKPITYCQQPTATYQKEQAPNKERKTPVKLPLWRKISAGFFSILSILLFIYSAKNVKFSEMIENNSITALGKEQLMIYAALLVSLLLALVLISRKKERTILIQPQNENRKLSKRTGLSIVLVFLMIPLTLFIGVEYLDVKQYYLTALAVLTECMLPFFMVFEKRKPKARELVLIAVLCALSIAGRAAFFMLPQFKPVLAMTIISGVALGGETGFLVGAVTMLVSNIMFSQGPWTPFQMFAMGIIGFLAGIMYRKNMLHRTKASLCIFGAVSAILIYGGITNLTSALVWGSASLNIKMIMGYYLSGLPMDCIHAASTVIFLMLIGEPMLEKLDRIKVKYGMISVG